MVRLNDAAADAVRASSREELDRIVDNQTNLREKIVAALSDDSFTMDSDEVLELLAEGVKLAQEKGRVIRSAKNFGITL